MHQTMLLFAPPPPTRYDLHFTIAGIPIRVHPLFWLVTALFAVSANDLVAMLLWIPVVFISIVIHELGHAFAFRRYGQPSYVVLHGAGGLTVPEPVPWGSRWANVSLRPAQEILISFAGPATGFLLAALIMFGVLAVGGSIVVSRLLGIFPLPMAFLPTGGRLLNLIVLDFLWVNIFWGLINLLPVYPLDGGNIARYALLKFDPLNGVRTSLWISVITGGVIALLALLFLRSIYIAILFGLLAFQSYQVLSSRYGQGY